LGSRSVIEIGAVRNAPLNERIMMLFLHSQVKRTLFPQRLMRKINREETKKTKAFSGLSSYSSLLRG